MSSSNQPLPDQPRGTAGMTIIAPFDELMEDDGPQPLVVASPPSAPARVVTGDQQTPLWVWAVGGVALVLMGGSLLMITLAGIAAFFLLG
ncbi:MAG: hypothetical protein KTR31_14635 [Myxococcales bacterium]|nr:hypothetical protein [Myxococcales bacterium]